MRLPRLNRTMIFKTLPVPLILVVMAIQGYNTQNVFPSYKLQHWKFRESTLSFPHNPSVIFPLASSQHKLKVGKPRSGYTSIALPTSLYPSIKKNEVHVDAVNKLVDRASAASIHSPSYNKHHSSKGGPPQYYSEKGGAPHYGSGKGGPAHYPPLNRKALYATGLIYLRDFRPGGPLYRK